MPNTKLDRYIKNSNGIKVEQVTTSLNLEKAQLEFVKENNLNLSAMVRDFIQSLMDAAKGNK